ncbi:MAG: SDR family NAD(P)-dependent oxidoreductase [Candidatus Hatepunaea meridiana]|nr:SDR family NAD(P)-dependent oxidoreductase [Candidatus Hatepunaea meridiana]
MLKNKTILITGASAGIGEACANAFAAEGANLVLAARRHERLVKMADELTTKCNIKCRVSPLDVRDNIQVEEFIHNLPVEFQNIDILINNAGLARGLDSIQNGNIRDWDEMIDTNLKGLLYITRAVIPGMIERGNGHIINIGSIAGRQPYPNGTVYCATKFAVRALTQGMLMDMVDTPIRVSTVDPGMTKTEFSRVRLKRDDVKADSVYDGLTPLTAQDIAEAVLFCATRPPHSNITEMVILPADQASAYHAHRRK